MFRAVTVLCAIAVFLVILQQVACHRHGSHHHGRHGHHRHHHRGPPHHRLLWLNVAIYEPKGCELSTQKFNSTAQYFGFDMFINNPNGGTPDVSHNTSEVTYGKYIVSDTEVIIKPGDMLNITYYMGFADGGVMKSTITFPVFQHMIRNNCSCENATGRETPSKTPVPSIPPWLRTTTIPPRTTNDPRYINTHRPTPPPMLTTTITPMEQSNTEYSDELFDCEVDPATNLCSDNSLMDIRISHDRMSRRQPEKLVNHPDSDVNLNVVMDIFNMVVDQCETKTRTNYLAMARPVYLTDASTDWVGFVRKTLKEKLNLSRLADQGLVGAQPSGTVILFKMDTLFNKLLVLYYARKSDIGGLVVDVDGIQIE